MSRPRATGPTQATIARATGVSVPTVSKALRADPSISARTRDLVLASAHELGYPVPGAPTAQTASAAAPTPPGRTRRRISVLFDMVDNAYAAELLEGLLSAARTLEFALQIDHVGVSADRLGPEAEGTTLLLGEQALEGADGLVLVTTPVPPALLQRCHELGAPLLAIDPATQPPTGVVSLSATNWRGGRQATDHLIGLGHRRIGVICGQRSSVPAVERLAGYHSALAQAGISPEADLIRPGRFGFDAGLTEGTALLSLPHPPTAIFGMSDTIAIGVTEAARRRGLRVPEDLSVIGFDDTSLARFNSPQLTVIHQPLTEIGSEALQLMSRALKLGHVPGSPSELQTTLVVRDSTAPPPSR